MRLKLSLIFIDLMPGTLLSFTFVSAKVTKPFVIHKTRHIPSFAEISQNLYQAKRVLPRTVVDDVSAYPVMDLLS